MILSWHAIHQPITGFGNDAIPECNAANTPYITASIKFRKGRQEEGREFSGSLAEANSKPLTISAYSS